MKNKLQHVKHAHTVFDHRFSGLMKRNPGFKVTCSKGCSACCSEAVYVLADEAKLIIRSIPPEELAGVTERTRAWLERAKTSKMLEAHIPHVFAYRSAQLVCPLLKDGLCLVYANRPLGCRGHNAIGEPKLCENINDRLTQKFVNAIEYINEARDTLMNGSKRPVEGDHLGVFLSRKLLGETGVSGSHLEAE